LFWRTRNNHIPEHNSATSSQARERLIVYLLCALAAARVLALSAAFPLFNNVDEFFHYDYVWKCGHGSIPDPMELPAEEATRVFATYGWSAWYMHSVEEIISEDVAPPLWTTPEDVRDSVIQTFVPEYRSIANHETVQPPLYYATAGAWYRLGEYMGIPDRVLPFWVRFLNAPLTALLVWVSYCIAKLFFPENAFIRLGTPALLSAIPQDAFYSISNSAMGPIIFTVALYALALVFLDARRSHLTYAAAGLAAGASVITMYPAAAAAPVFAVVALAVLLRTRATGVFRPTLWNVVLLCCAAALPVVAWLGRNYVVMGTPTAQPYYVSYAGWKPLEFSEMLNHPIFTTQGATYFLREVLASYFRGEFFAQGKRLSCSWLDSIYVWSSLAFLLIAIVSFVQGPRGRRAVGLTSAALFALGIVSLVGASIRYDFGNWFCPSREMPYFVAGRLIYWTVVPFAFMYLTGMEVLLSRLRLGKIKFAVLIAFCGLMVGSDIVMSIPAFSATCNLFHLLPLNP